MVICLLSLSAQIFFTSQTPSSSLKFLLLYVDQLAVGLVYFFVAVARAAALVVNGRSLVYGPQFRAWGAIFGALIWAQMEVSLLKLYFCGVTNNSPGISLYFAMTLGELVTVYRASTDVRRQRT